jgi:acyl-CoA thioester hydrolase
MNATDPARGPFDLEIPVSPEDIDGLGHVGNIVYLRWVQEVAIAHWRSTATAGQQSGLLWVVLRHEIDYRYPARPGDVVIARTRVGVATGQSFERHTEILRKGDLKPLAVARTIWTPIDATTGRPKRVSDEIRHRFSVPAAGSQ